MRVDLKSTRYFLCPHGCPGQKFEVEHLIEDAQKRGKIRDAGPWYCDVCHKGFDIKAYPGGSVEIEEAKKRIEPALIILAIPPLPEPIYLLTEGYSHPEEQHAFHYNENTCPLNYLGSSLRTIEYRKDTDPHGIARFVKEIPWEPRPTYGPREKLLSDEVNRKEEKH